MRDRNYIPIRVSLDDMSLYTLSNLYIDCFQDYKFNRVLVTKVNLKNAIAFYVMNFRPPYRDNFWKLTKRLAEMRK